MNLDGKIAVVTGGASGIGEACCHRFATAGATVVVADIAADKAECIAAEIDGHAVAIDVADEHSISVAAQRIIAEVGPVDILVNSAGIIQPPVPPENLPQETWDRIIQIDLRGVYLCCNLFGTQMARRKTGAIVNIASTAGMLSMPLHAYGPAKSAVIALTQGLAAEWGPRGVRVNAVSPGFTVTPVLQAAFEAGTRDPKVLIANMPLGRLVEPGDIAEAVCFLVSDAARSITGVNLPVDCGFLVSAGWHAFGGLR
jgi:NAD(P)-dependent dehydrogenase (short-subunit alcohol dehydrogenase family)